MERFCADVPIASRLKNVRALGLGVDIYECIVPEWRILPKRWLVERALAWINHSCRLSKDYEITVASAEALCMIVALRSMIARFWYWYGFLYLHEYYPETKAFIAIEDRGEGDYYLVNGKDEVYEYDVNLGKLVQVKYTLFEYIVHRFEQVDRTLNT